MVSVHAAFHHSFPRLACTSFPELLVTVNTIGLAAVQEASTRAMRRSFIIIDKFLIDCHIDGVKIVILS